MTAATTILIASLTILAILQHIHNRLLERQVEAAERRARIEQP